MSLSVTESIVLITSSDPNNDNFGTGFVNRRSGDYIYIVTCAHVIYDVGITTTCINGISGVVIVTGDNLGLDLAVIKVQGLRLDTDCLLPVSDSSAIGDTFVTEGFQVFDRHTKTHMKRELKGNLTEHFQITAQPPNNPIQAWRLCFEEGSVQEGYSGSPVIDIQSGNVLGVISHRLSEGFGAAISIKELNRIWQPLDRHKLREALLQLGYRLQARTFRKLIETKPIGAYLIHGPTERYGQQWLVNRLLTQYVPTSMTAKKFRVSLNRVGRRGDIKGLWSELAMELNCDRNVKPREIAKQALKWWRSRDIIFALYDVDCLSEELLNLLVHEFWLPLANEAEGMRTQGNLHNLLMFLIDYESVTAQRNVPFTEKIDTNSTTYYPFKSPQNREFSKDELTDWMDSQHSLLPEEMIKQTDETVDNMHKMSDGGIPEWTFVEICKRCGYDWRTESIRWCSI